jgi:hypothetical protein
MVDLAEIGLILQTISVMSAATAAVIGVRSYINSNKHSEEAKKKEQETRDRELQTRKTQLFMDLFNLMAKTEYLEKWTNINEKWSWTSFDDFMSKYGPNDAPEKWTSFLMVASEWERIGILVNHGIFDIDMLYDQWGGFYTDYWEKIEPVIVEWNVRHRGGFLEYAEDLYYLFKETHRTRDTDFSTRDKVRIQKRTALGLKPRQPYL